MIDRWVLELLVCPDCRGDLREVEDFVVCCRCGLKYPVRNGTPIMLIEEARKQQPAPPSDAASSADTD